MFVEGHGHNHLIMMTIISPSLSSLHPETSIGGMNPFFSRLRRRLSRIELAGNDALDTRTSGNDARKKKQKGRGSKKQKQEHGKRN